MKTPSSTGPVMPFSWRETRYINNLGFVVIERTILPESHTPADFAPYIGIFDIRVKIAGQYILVPDVVFTIDGAATPAEAFDRFETACRKNGTPIAKSRVIAQHPELVDEHERMKDE